MGRDPWRHAAKLLDDGTVFQLLVNVGGRAGEWKLSKAGTSTPRAPGGQRHREGSNCALDEIQVDPATPQVSAERGMLIEQRLGAGVVVVADQGRGQGRLGIHGLRSSKVARLSGSAREG